MKANAIIDAPIDAFIDALWLEEGLSKNTLSAYRRDLTLYAVWLQLRDKVLIDSTEGDLNAYFAAQHPTSKATTANRRLTVFKRYFRWALRERLIASDPTLKLQAATQAMRVPKTLTEAQVEALQVAVEAGTSAVEGSIQGVSPELSVGAAAAAGLGTMETPFGARSKPP